MSANLHTQNNTITTTLTTCPDIVHCPTTLDPSSAVPSCLKAVRFRPAPFRLALLLSPGIALGLALL